MEIKPYAAIDIGSTSVRMLITNVIESKNDRIFQKAQLITVPLNLGYDTFEKGKISKINVNNLMNTLSGFSCLMKAYRVIDFETVASSAIREASNGKYIMKKINRTLGINAHLISDKKVAELIFANKMNAAMPKGKNYLFVNVGGGSTDIILFSNGATAISKSFDVGSVRMIKKNIKKSVFVDMKNWLEDITAVHSEIDIIGGGAYMNSLVKFTNLPGRDIGYNDLYKIHENLVSFSYNDRIRILGLRPYAAKVIVPAVRIYLAIMQWTLAENIYVPEIGLPEGLIQDMYHRQNPE